jgi:hypothetical protein
MNNATRKKLWTDFTSNKIGSPDEYGLQKQSSLSRYVKSLSEINQACVCFDKNKETIAKNYLHLYLTNDLSMNLLGKINIYFEVEDWPKVHDALMQEGISSRDYTKFFKEKLSHLFRADYSPKRPITVQSDDESQEDLLDALFPGDHFEDVTFQTMKEELHEAKQEIESLMDKVQVLSQEKSDILEKLRELKTSFNDRLDSLVD